MNQQEFAILHVVKVLLAILLVAGGGLRADEVEARFFQGLLERELFRVAEDYAQRQLQDPSLDAVKRVAYTIQLSEALCQHARLTTDPSADAIWAEAERVVLNLQDSQPAEPSTTLLQVQLARVSTARARALRFEAEIQGENQQLRQQGLVQLRIAVQRLQQLQSQLKALDSVKADQPAPAQRLAISEEVQSLLAESYVEQGRLSPAGPQRAGAWQTANDLLEDLIRTQRDESMKSRSRLLRASVARRQQDESTAETLLKSMLAETADVPRVLKDAAVAELARLRLDQSRTAEALQLLSDRVKQRPVATPEVRAMVVESLIVLWQSAGKQGRTDLQAGVIEKAEEQLALTGGEWHRWAASRLERIREERDFGPDLAALITSGRSAYQAGQIPVAIKAYGDAANVAEAKQLIDKAVELLLTQGALQLQSSQDAAAAETFARVESRFPSHPRAQEADSLKCYALGRVVDQQGTADSNSAYLSALESHIQKYPGSDSAAESAWRLGLLHEHLHNLPAAWRAFQTVPAQHASGDQALLRMSQIVQRLASGPEPLEADQILTAVQELEERLIRRAPAAERLNPLQAEIALQLAGTLQQFQGEDPSLAARSASWIQRVQSAIDAETRDAHTVSRELDPDWVRLGSQVTKLKIIVLASQKHLDEAQVLIEQLAQADPGVTLQVLHGLSDLAGQRQSVDQPFLGRLQLQAATVLNQKRGELTADQQLTLDDCLLESNLAIGRLGDALALYSARSTPPARTDLLQRISEQVLTEGDPANLKMTRLLWSAQEGKAQKGTPGWLTARLMIARLLAREGAIEECRKLIGVTKIIYPELGGAKLAQQFQEVLDSLPSK